jgi:hypothetical protein
MAANASKVRAQYDTATAVTLADAETVTATGWLAAGAPLSELDTAYWHSNEIPQGMFKVEVNVTAINLSTNTYTINLGVDDTADLSDTPTVLASFAITVVGHYTFIVDSKVIEALDTVTVGLDKWVGIGTTIAGTPDSPSVTFDAWISRNVGA